MANNFKAKIPARSEDCILSVPTEVTGENYALQSGAPSATVIIRLSIETSQIQIAMITPS